MTDFKIDENGDLDIQGGDFVVVESTLQHQSDIIWAEKAWFKNSPSLGAGLQSFLNESGSAPGLMRTIRQELERDGMKVNSISLDNDNINIDGEYEAI